MSHASSRSRRQPKFLFGHLERVKLQSRKSHIHWGSGGAEATQDQTQPFGMLCLDANLGAGLEELGQPLVFEPADHAR